MPRLEGDDDDFELTDEDAEKLLADAVNADDSDDSPDDDDKGDEKDSKPSNEGGDPSKLGDPGKRALDAMKRERNAARKELQEFRAKLKQYEDKDKTEAQRLQEARDEAATRAAKAEEQWRSMSVAMERAPAHATLAQVKAVAKRVRGESEEDMETDADELFELLAPAPQTKEEPPPRKVAGKPRERLRGGGDPDEEPEESDPRKLADMIRRTKF